jgi:hypothetical protein
VRTPTGGSHSRTPSISGSVAFGYDTQSDEPTEIMHFSSEGGKLVVLLQNDVARKVSRIIEAFLILWGD